MVQIRESRAQGTSRSSGLGLFTALLYWETCALLAGPGNLGEFAELLGRLSPGTVTCSGSDVCVPPEVMCMPLCVCAPPEMMCVPLCTAGGGGFLFFPTRSKKEMGFSWSGLGNATLNYDSGAGWGDEKREASGRMPPCGAALAESQLPFARETEREGGCVSGPTGSHTIEREGRFCLMTFVCL